MSKKLLNFNLNSIELKLSALTNPDLDIFVLFSFEVGVLDFTHIPLIDAIMSYKNVHLRYLDLFEYSKDTPLEKWMQDGAIFKSIYIVEHISDILRILTLWKYTGTYLDLDAIITRSVKPRGKNFACLQDNVIGTGVLNFDDNLGRMITEKYLKKVEEKFNGNSWAGNGPIMLTDLISKEICNTSKSLVMNREECKGFEVLPAQECYAIHYTRWRYFFKEKYLNATMKIVENSFAVHFWNHLSAKKKLKKDSNTAYINIARKFCPNVMQSCGDSF